MGSGEGSPRWSVFDGVKIVPSTPEALLAEINTAIINLEYTRATAHLDSSSSLVLKNMSFNASVSPQYDAKLADEAYKAGCAALAAGKLDEALHSLNISLSKCPPDKTSAVAKLQSLISLTSLSNFTSLQTDLSEVGVLTSCSIPRSFGFLLKRSSEGERTDRSSHRREVAKFQKCKRSYHGHYYIAGYIILASG